MVEPSASIVVEPKEGYLRITLPKYESLMQGQSEVSRMYDAVEEHDARRLLVDCRATRKQIPILELYELAIYVVAKFRPSYPRMAVLASTEAAYPDRFGENVMRNRGLDVIRFLDDETEALSWLLE